MLHSTLHTQYIRYIYYKLTYIYTVQKICFHNRIVTFNLNSINNIVRKNIINNNKNNNYKFIFPPLLLLQQQKQRKSFGYLSKGKLDRNDAFGTLNDDDIAHFKSILGTEGMLTDEEELHIFTIMIGRDIMKVKVSLY